MSRPLPAAARPRFSRRRKALLAAVLVMLAAMGVLRWLGVAGFSGTQPREMDWDSDGTVTQAEMLQGFTVIAVTERRDGRRTCRSYARLRAPDQPLRVDCRVEIAAGEGG
ncbi:MAG: EF-hand domain-containing protein [Proteobacteria bacterium]|nr:EF-hand domain-containing protein [Pseudomonadota bacterium]